MHSKVRISLVVLACLFTPRAHAQSFRLDHFRSAERADDGFGVRRLSEFGHLRLGGLLTGDYAHDPLVIEARGGGQKELQTIVDHQLMLKLDLSLSLYDRVVVFGSLEAVPLLKGPAIPATLNIPRADGGGMGDLSLGARARIWGEADDFFAIGAQAALIVSTAGSQRYRGEETIAVRPEIIAELRPKYVRLSANLGLLLRREQSLLDARVGNELLYAIGAGVPIPGVERLEGIAELWGGYTLKDTAARTATPLEWLLGGKYHTLQGLWGAAAIGTGFTHGIGAPDVRVIAQLGYLSPKKPPASDRDHDGIPDAQDACPDVPEDVDGFQDQDGCPDLDDDQDGILDSNDACVREPEDHDNFKDEDGCPEPDNDGDGILDRDDACPDVPGVPATKGCPPPVSIDEEGELHVLDQILFENNRAVILPESIPHVQAVQTLLGAHPEIAKVRIEGHTDSVGQDAKNLALSRERAAAVGSWLVEHGTDRTRLSAYGCGETHPVDDNNTEAGRAKNRRVVFQVIGPTPREAARTKAPAGCVEAKIP